MPKLSFSPLVAAALAAATQTVHAQPQVTANSTISAVQTRANQAAAVVHFEGCLFTEPALTAKTPIVVPAGVPQKWVLTSVKVIAGDIKDEEATQTTYALTKVNDERARPFYGKRVGVTGRVSAGSPRPNLDVVDLREISGGCPVLPSLS